VTEPVPSADGVNVTEQLAVEPVAAPSVHCLLAGLNVPAMALFANATVPVGVVAPGEVSVTVAVHVEGEPSSTVAGAHDTEVVVRPFAVSGAGTVVALAACPVSPA